MSWFDEQIRQRKKSDQDIFEDSVFQMASVILGKKEAGLLDDERMLTKDAIDDILKYYRYKPVDIPNHVHNPGEQLEYCLRPYGLMWRNVRLTENWYKDAYGPMLVRLKENDKPVALLPKSLTGYWYKDPDTGKRVSVDNKTARVFSEDAICFYRSLPLRAIGIPDLLKYMRGCISLMDVVVLVGATFLVTVVGMLLPRLTKMLTGFVLQSKSTPFLMGTAVFMACVIISSQMISAIKMMALSRIEIKTSLSVEAAVYARVMNLPADFFRKFSSGELSSRCGTINQLCELMINTFLSVGLTSVMSLLYIVQIFKYAKSLVIPSLGVILLTTVVSLITSFLQARVTRQSLEYAAKESGISFALISGIQKIKLAGAEKRAFARWAKAYSKTARLQYDPPLLLKVSSVITGGIALVGTIILYYLAVKTGVTPSEYIAFNTAYGMVMGAFSSLASVALSIAQIPPILNMAEPILAATPESAEEKEIITSLSGGIEINHVSFRYSENLPYVIDDLSLKIKDKEYVAIVGRTGCGKSTLMRLLLGFEMPQKGAIYYNGKDITKLDLRSLRRRIGSVTQDGTLFQGDIYSNIVISAPQLNQEQAWEAAEIAGIADDIRKMPMGMQTLISEGQGGVSGGQKQRLMIARAIAPKPKILMFDEATSALDNRTQKKVSEALDRLKCTRIVIAHRLSTIRNCDRIVVLDGGKIVEDGTFEELISHNGLFAELVERQRLDVG